jgi:TatD DNase family protein
MLGPLVDSHCHLDQPLFDADRDEVVARARAAGVERLLLPAIRPTLWARQQRLRDAHPGLEIALAIGVHPQVVPELTPDERATALDPARLAAAAVAAGAVAVGECGLDGGTEDRALQEAVLRAHVRAARAVGLPLVVHVLRAHDLAPRVLREEGVEEVGGVLHSYSGGAELVPVYAALGFHFSFAGPVTYDRARRPVEAARAVAPERLLAETDAPDQAPAPHRGGRCEPAHVADVVRGLAAARGERPETIAALTTANAARLFWRGEPGRRSG